MDSLMDGALGEAAHPQQPLLQFFQIVFKMAFHVFLSSSRRLLTGVPLRDHETSAIASHPKRPVM